MTKQFTDLVRRSPLVAYFVLVFGIEWLLVPLALTSLVPPLVALLLGSWLPNGVGVLVTAATGGSAGLRRLLERVRLWRIGHRWYVIALCLPTTTAGLAIGIGLLSGIGAPEPAGSSYLLPIFLGAVFTGALGEELGWRGTALPHLLARWNALASNLILGILWGLYHLPSFLLAGMPLHDAPLVAFMVASIGITTLMTWTFNRTAGSLIPVFLYHFAFNFLGNATGIFGDATLVWLWAGILGAVAMAVIALEWARFTQPAASVSGDVWQTA